MIQQEYDIQNKLAYHPSHPEREPRRIHLPRRAAAAAAEDGSEADVEQPNHNMQRLWRTHSVKKKHLNKFNYQVSVKANGRVEHAVMLDHFLSLFLEVS